jgi:hypothetical protein
MEEENNKTEEVVEVVISEPVPEEPKKEEVPAQKVDGRKNHDRLFKKGQSGNPKGKPKGVRHFSTLIKEAIKKVAEGDAEPADRLIVKQLVDKAKKGDLAAIDRIMDRVDGKAEQNINLDAEINIDDGLSQEEKEALLNLLK